ncbi:hypothetical protein BHE74_00006764 [Ensete ventricosum]|nr:hypothetical protein BHE74_00006764 [Ensete ventricosum]
MSSCYFDHALSGRASITLTFRRTMVFCSLFIFLGIFVPTTLYFVLFCAPTHRAYDVVVQLSLTSTSSLFCRFDLTLGLISTDVLGKVEPYDRSSSVRSVWRRRVVLYRSVYTGSVADRYADQSLSGDTTKIDRRRSISTVNDRLTEKSIVDDQLKKKKGKEEEEKKKEEEVPTRALAAWVDRESSPPAGRPRDVIAVAARERLSSPRWERDRGDLGCDMANADLAAKSSRPRTTRPLTWPNQRNGSTGCTKDTRCRTADLAQVRSATPTCRRTPHHQYGRHGERRDSMPAPALRHSRASLTFNNCLAQDTGGVCDFGGETGGGGSRRKRGTVGGIQITLPDSLFPVHLPSLFPVVASLLHGFPCRSFS